MDADDRTQIYRIFQKLRDLKSGLIYSLLAFSLYLTVVSAVHDIDNYKYEEGKRQFEVVQKNSLMPRYGQCWTNTMTALVSGCKQLTDIEQSRLALAYLNCFLQVQGKRFYPCDLSDEIKVCTVSMTDSDSAAYATFFTHTQNICYFLEAQILHENTEKTVGHLLTTSEEVAEQLDKSSNLQQVVIQQQTISIQKQNLILDQATNLSLTINTSSNNIHNMFNDFRKSTDEQRQLIYDIFDRVSQLQSLVLGEFSWFYSFIYYVLAILVCYILTSTPRTSGVRIWLYILMTLNVAVEKFLVGMTADLFGIFIRSLESSDQKEIDYSIQWMFRKTSMAVGLVMLVYFAINYQDVHSSNNKLLKEIKLQNEELCKVLKEKKEEKKKQKHTLKTAIDELKFSSHTPKAEILAIQNSSSESSDMDTSDLDIASPSLHRADISITEPQSHSKPSADTDDDESVSSFSTALTGKPEVKKVSTRSSRRSSSLQRELRNLQNSTPFKDLSGNIQSWATSGSYKGIQESHSDTAVPGGYQPAASAHLFQNVGNASGPRKYLLRQRRLPGTQRNPKYVL